MPSSKKNTIKNSKKINSEIKGLRQQLVDLEEKLKRTLADYQNQSRRYQSRQSEVVLFANQKLLDKFLSLLDSLEIAQLHLKDKGLNIIIDQFNQILTSEDVKLIKTDNKPFNPENMDCTAVVEGDKNIVVNTTSLGYTHHDRVLRPAKVEVGSGKKAK